MADLRTNPIFSYAGPFGFYIVLTQIAGKFPDYYVLLYPMAAFVTSALLIYVILKHKLLTFHGNVLPGIVVGIIGILLWIVICRLPADEFIFGFLPSWMVPESRPGFDPFSNVESVYGVWSFICIRILGLAVVTPLAEELFWRGFLMRWLIDPDDWRNQPVGRFTVSSFLWVTVLFTMAHSEWTAAVVYCLLINALIYWKKDIWNCVVAHGISNLILSVYILQTHSWSLW